MSVEIRRTPEGDVIMWRRMPGDATKPGGTVLRFTEREWSDFVAGVRAGEFDLEGPGEPDGPARVPDVSTVPRDECQTPSTEARSSLNRRDSIALRAKPGARVPLPPNPTHPEETPS